MQADDGLGRTVQNWDMYRNVAGEGQVHIVFLTEYDAAGRPICAGAPFTLTTSSGYPSESCDDHDPASTTYNALGRPLTVTLADGNSTEYAYNIVTEEGEKRQETVVIDANDHKTSQKSNALGQLVVAEVYTGTGATGAPWTVYSSAAYEYDLMGNLVSVIRASAEITATTTITYDHFGRKTAMDDPDMGVWLYAYDAVGNLTRQEDAEGQVLCFYYDKLDRLLRKVVDTSPTDDCPALESAPDDGSEHLASYSYDTATNGIGQVAEAGWGADPADDQDRFAFDSQGRVISQTRTIDGRDYIP